jgi:hypothetical protein
MNALSVIHKLQRAVLVLWALVGGGISLLTLIVPRVVIKEVVGVGVTPAAVIFCQMLGGMQLGLALVALVAALVPRPPRTLVWAIGIALASGNLAAVFSALLNTVAQSELKPFNHWLWVNGGFAGLLLGTAAVREILRRRAA